MAGVPVLLVTANVGSIFEDPSVMLKIWTEEFLSTILRLDPKFIALHCQEVGGKNYEQSMRHVEDFVRLLMSSEELRLFDKIRVFLDEDYSSAEHFTALGNFYFVHESFKDVLLWDFKECIFVPVNGKEVHSGNIEAVTTKEKAKFPQEFFPECKWSRKGFLRTRWSISGTVFDLINIHLFHDASNFIAMETFPSVYSKTRRRALEHTLDRFHNDKYPNVPYFLFGDFNFRTDTAGVIKKLTENTQEKKLSSKGSISKLQFRNKEDDLVLTLGKKEFSHYEHQNVFIQNSGEWLREYDRELEDFDGRLYEFPIKFVPSYPFEEDINEGTNYMQTRVPAWCDRVLLSPTAKSLVLDISSPDAVEYGIIGPTTCMGDHKPVYLKAKLHLDAGTINCCSLPNALEFCFRVPENYLELLSMLPDYSSCVNARALYVDRSSNLLHAAPIRHDPYTPDSMDSPSPNAIIAAGEIPDVEVDHVNNGADSASILQSSHTANTARRIDRAVSPALLKSKLELIVRSKKQEAMSTELDPNEMKRSPSECHVQWYSTDTDTDDRHWAVRKNRCNSDISWQRSHVLTQAWVQGKGQQGYHSFSGLINRPPTDSSPPECMEGLPDLVIPRIAIINASNFESNESSIYLFDDKLSTYSENKLSVCSDGRTKTLSSEALSLEKSDETSSKLDTESNRLSPNTEKLMETKSDESLQNISEEMCFKESNTSLTKDIVDTAEMINFEFQQCLSESMNIRNVEVTNDNKNVYISADTKDHEKTITQNLQSLEKCTVSQLFPVTIKKTTSVELIKEDIEVYSKIKSHDKDVTGTRDNEPEISRCESKPEVTTPKSNTRSNSIQSQDNSDNAENVKQRLKACKVTEKCKNNIAKKKSRCRRCCVIS